MEPILLATGTTAASLRIAEVTQLRRRFLTILRAVQQLTHMLGPELCRMRDRESRFIAPTFEGGRLLKPA